MAISRRQFIKCSGLATAGGLLGPSLFRNLWVRKAMAETIGNRAFVVVYLDGGNDGLNTVVPASANSADPLRSAYEAARALGGGGGLQLTPDDLQDTLIGLDPATGEQLALHPGFAPWFQGPTGLCTLNRVAVIQGCGYPDYSLSHEESRRIWQAADPFGQFTTGNTGWVGRHIADPSAAYTGADIPAISIANNVTGELRQSLATVLAIRSVEEFTFPFEFENGSGDDPAKKDAFYALHSAAVGTGQPILGYVGNTGVATVAVTISYPALHANYVAQRPVFNAAYDAINRGLARDLREVAKVLYGQVDNGDLVSPDPVVHARFFQVSNGGYDTHSNQGASDPAGQHFGLHNEVAQSLQVFYDDLADMGIADKVTTIVYSEFSRRIEQNENGTDHGSQGPVFVVGGSVNGGVYGRHPNIEASALDDEGNTIYSQDGGNAFRSTDLRDVYGTILEKWFNMPSGVIVPNVLKLDTGNPLTRWTVPDFDLRRASDSAPLFVP